MFWREYPWWKWIGVAIIGVHMAVTNIGIWSYLSSGYTLQEAPVAAVERQIESLDERMAGYVTLEGEALRRISSMDTAYEQLVVKRFTTRAERYQKENSEMRAKLEAQRDDARAEIRKLDAARDALEEQVVANAAKLGSIEHLSAFTDGDREDILQIVAWFTLLLMLGLDPAAIMMVILFTSLLSKKMAAENAHHLDEMDDEKKDVVKHLDEIGYLDNRKKKK